MPNYPCGLLHTITCMYMSCPAITTVMFYSYLMKMSLPPKIVHVWQTNRTRFVSGGYYCSMLRSYWFDFHFVHCKVQLEVLQQYGTVAYETMPCHFQSQLPSDCDSDNSPFDARLDIRGNVILQYKTVRPSFSRVVIIMLPGAYSLRFPAARSDCAVCAEHFSPRIAYRCGECSEKARRSAAGLVVATFVVVMVVAVVLLKHLGSVADSDGRGAGARRISIQRKCVSFQNSLMKVLPLTAIKIVVVVWQIVFQVSRWSVNLRRGVRVEFTGREWSGNLRRSIRPVFA